MRKKILRIEILSLILLLTVATNTYAQAQYEILQDDKSPQTKILKGLITKSIIENDTAIFKWYVPNKKNYQPDTTVVGMIQKAKNKVQYVIFGGTWCEDTQVILPKFFKLQEKTNTPENSVTLFGVDRSKKTMGNIAAVFNITNVPTIIVMKEGKEIGRVVEYGKTGSWDKELAEIIKQLL